MSVQRSFCLTASHRQSASPYTGNVDPILARAVLSRNFSSISPGVITQVRMSWPGTTFGWCGSQPDNSDGNLGPRTRIRRKSFPPFSSVLLKRPVAVFILLVRPHHPRTWG